MASLTGFEFNEGGLHNLFTDTTGGIAAAMFAEGERIVVAAKEYVGIQWPGGPSAPPQPFRRSGELQNSIRAIEPLVINGVMQVQIWADPVNETSGFPYAPWLLEHGYQFVDLESLGD